MKTRTLTIIAGTALSALTTLSMAGDGGTLFSSSSDVAVFAEPGTSFNIITQSCHSAAAIVLVPNECDGPSCAPFYLDSDADFDFLSGQGTTYAEVSVFAGSQSCGKAGGYSESRLNTTTQVIAFSGEASGYYSGKRCEPIAHGGGAYGSNVDFEILGNGEIRIGEQDPCHGGGAQDFALSERFVLAEITCLSGPAGSTIYSDSTVQIGFDFAFTCASGVIPVGPGTFNLDFTHISIGDTTHDLTGDSRFNIEDAALLQSIVGTPDALLPLYVDLFDYNQDGEIDQSDVDLVNKFIDAGLSSGLFGDTNRDGVVNCCDLAGYDAAFGSSFDTAATPYLVELDWDLDGDIDAVDRAEFDQTACIADIDNSHVLDFFDTSDFLDLYGAGDPSVDFDNSGVVDFFDLSMFLDAFGKSCP